MVARRQRRRVGRSPSALIWNGHPLRSVMPSSSSSATLGSAFASWPMHAERQVPAPSNAKVR
eukprot:11221517-Lingulodinium_polyedra.AAC.1